MTSRIALPISAHNAHDAVIKPFCEWMIKTRRELGFDISARGWCYMLENEGVITKDKFKKAESIIGSLRKAGKLPLDITAEDESRRADYLESLDSDDIDAEADSWMSLIERAHGNYKPVSFWTDKSIYLEVWVEKIDLKGLFDPICQHYHVPLVNARGSSDINSRAAALRRFAQREAEGCKGSIILYCGDHDPYGIRIDRSLGKNLEDVERAAGVSPKFMIKRFGLNQDFIEQHAIPWIDNLETSSGGNLANPRHNNHHDADVQQYLRKYGARKVEANALVVRPEAGRRLCEEAILQYLPKDAPERYVENLAPHREALQQAIKQRLLNFTLG